MTAGPGSQPPQPPDPTTWLERHGDALYRYAVLHLGSRDVAEDLVQETLLAGLRGYADFEGRSSERTWLIGILKRKVIDHVRKQARRSPEADIAAAEELVAGQFAESGLWELGPRKWGRDPEQAFATQEFWDVFVRCLTALPERLAAAFALRELDDVESDDICKDLGVTATNLWTLLHRARTRLRACLEENWFSGPAGKT